MRALAKRVGTVLIDVTERRGGVFRVEVKVDETCAPEEALSEIKVAAHLAHIELMGEPPDREWLAHAAHYLDGDDLEWLHDQVRKVDAFTRRAQVETPTARPCKDGGGGPDAETSQSGDDPEISTS